MEFSSRTWINPGWHLTVDLVGTELQWREFKELAIERTREDWGALQDSGNKRRS